MLVSSRPAGSPLVSLLPAGLSKRRPCVLAAAALFLIFPCTRLVAQSEPAASKGRFQLRGTLLGRDTGAIVLWYPDTTGKYVRDTARLQNGTFEFQGHINEPSFTHLVGSRRDGNYASFFLEPGLQTITIEENKFSRLQMTGSRSQSENETLRRLRAGAEQQRELLVQQRQKLEQSIAGNPGRHELAQKQLDSLEERIGVLTEEIIAISIEFIRDHPRSYVSATELLGLVNQVPPHTLSQLFYSFVDPVRKGRAGQLLRTEVEKRAGLQAGNLLPDFTAKDIAGNDFSLSAFRGKYVLLEFWASWCIPCRKAIPDIKKLYATYHQEAWK